MPRRVSSIRGGPNLERRIVGCVLTESAHGGKSRGLQEARKINRGGSLLQQQPHQFRLAGRAGHEGVERQMARWAAQGGLAAGGDVGSRRAGGRVRRKARLWSLLRDVAAKFHSSTFTI